MSPFHAHGDLMTPRSELTAGQGPATPGTAPTELLFVCLGNICRSPLAEGVFLHLVREAGLESSFVADSAGTGGWHAGETPDPRSIEVARRHGIELRGPARKVRREDFDRFALILAMDRENQEDLRRLRPSAATRGEIALLREFDPEADADLDVPDPYYGGLSGFDRVFEMVHRACTGLLLHLESSRQG